MKGNIYFGNNIFRRWINLSHLCYFSFRAKNDITSTFDDNISFEGAKIKYTYKNKKKIQKVI